MKIFVAASYSSQVNYDTGKVFPAYKLWVEKNLQLLESFGHTVFCALRADDYKINNLDPAAAFSLDEFEIIKADALLAFLTNEVSAGVQTEIGMAIAKKKHVIMAHLSKHAIGYFNGALLMAGQATELILPISSDPLVHLN